MIMASPLPRHRRNAHADDGTPEMQPLVQHIALVTVLGVAVFTFTALLLWTALGFPALIGAHALDPPTKFSLIRIALSVVAGIGGVVALVVTYRRQRVNEQDQLREQTRLFNERFASACAQLGHDRAAVRLAGIYAVAGLADDWADQRQVCIDVLCAYLRLPYQPEAQTGWHHDEEGEVRLSVTKIIRDHLLSEAQPNWQGHDFDFTRATFHGADFTNAQFNGGHVSFSLTRFTGGWTAFDGACFSGAEVLFGGVTFEAGRVTFDSARFTGGRLTFNGTEFTGSQVSFRGAEFTGAAVDLSHVDLEHYDSPPEFDSWDHPPTGLNLPGDTSRTPAHDKDSKPADVAVEAAENAQA